ncbi:hypothetical protein CYMTET_35710 [Cymbomonas tetramitiformis]|uniref:Uncharacterized protein n=1 Tax=Cymbomonas tetramitiformis TaxID=36881 RepID=A0AAE0F8M2_9CHLO|nr:hypothetical protein CYMTET_35710 [Cymbomonas tetramitiformis]
MDTEKFDIPFESFGAMPSQTRTKLAKRYLATREEPECHPTIEPEMRALLRCVNLWGVGFDVCAGTNSIAEIIGRLTRLQMDSADVDVSREGAVDFVTDGLALKLRPNAYDFLVFSPPFDLTDVFIAWALQQPVKIRCFHVAGDYYTNAPDYRRRLLRPHLQEGTPPFFTSITPRHR